MFYQTLKDLGKSVSQQNLSFKFILKSFLFYDIFVYRIRANKPPAVYKKKSRFLGGVLLKFSKICPKKPQKVDFLGKKLVVYLNFVCVAVYWRGYSKWDFNLLDPHKKL